MGMDVYGCCPDEEVGKYFRNNVWGWHPLWTYCCEVNEHAAAVPYGHSNDGDGLNKHNAKRLGEELLAAIEAGETAEYVKLQYEELEGMPDEQCKHCHGTGMRDDQYVQGTCNGCQGKGKVRPFATNYSLDVDNVKEFAEFCVHSGGFEIW